MGRRHECERFQIHFSGFVTASIVELAHAVHARGQGKRLGESCFGLDEREEARVVLNDGQSIINPGESGRRSHVIGSVVGSMSPGRVPHRQASHDARLQLAVFHCMYSVHGSSPDDHTLVKVLEVLDYLVVMRTRVPHGSDATASVTSLAIW